MKKIDVLDLGFLNYLDAYKIQMQFHKKRANDEVGDLLIMVEHPHVITMGRASKREDILDREKIESLKVPIIEIDRGGGATYHGPGQMVIYPIFDLKGLKKDIRFYLNKLEETIIELLGIYSIESNGKGNMRGVWVRDRKIASIGIGISKWITYHGTALNISTDMDFFSFIKPCGFESATMISMEEILNKSLDKEKIKRELIEIFKDVFNKY